jgi:tripartite-type tricarboxylate transporter receptor subunit TctC
MDRRTLLKAAPAAMLAAATRSAWARDPSAIVKIVIPYSAGGQSDMMARTMSPSLTKALGHTVIVENKPGAAALIATKAIQAATPDANTVMLHNSGFVALPMLSKSADYDPQKDFTPVCQVGSAPQFLVVHASVPAKTVPEFIAYVKSLPAGIEAANAGLGSGGHLATQLLARRAGINILHVPYKGSSETARALVTGEVKMQLTSPTEVLTQQAKAGKVRFIAVSSKERSALAPELPTLGETLAGFAIEGWFGMLGPAGCPADDVRSLSDAFAKVLAEQEVSHRFLSLYMEPKHLGPAQFAEAIAASTTFWKGVVTELGIQRT